MEKQIPACKTGSYGILGDGNGICPVDVGPLGHGERDGSVPGDGGGEEACAGLGGDGSRAAFLVDHVKFRRNPAAFRRVDIHIQGRQGAVIGENRDETELFFRTVIDDGVNVLFFAVFQLDIGIAVGVCGAVGFDVVYDLLVIYLDNSLGRRVGGLFDRDGLGIGDTAGNGRDFCGTGFSGSDIAAGGNGSDTGIAAFPDDALFGVFQCQLAVGSGLQSQRGGG